MRMLQPNRVITAVLLTAMTLFGRTDTAHAQPAFAGIFGARDLEIENPNAPGSNYTMLLHDANDPGVYDELEYDPARGYGFIVLDPGNESEDRFGPFDDSPNNRDEFDPVDDLYNSFIGFKDFAQPCDASVLDDRNAPCSTEIDPDGGIFRVDVPNGSYRFVAVVGDADNPHAHRLLAENGGVESVGELTNNFVTLIGNHNQSALWQGTAEPDRFGTGVFARVGFDDKLPPAPQGDPEGSLPAFVDFNENGESVTECTSPLDPNDAEELLWRDEIVSRHDGTEYSVPVVDCTSAGPNSPTLEVTEGYIHFHILQGNSAGPVEAEDGAVFFSPEGVEINVGPDPNGGDMVLLEVWPVSAAGPTGDFNGDGVLDATDIDDLTTEVRAGTNNGAFDVTGDGMVNNDDRTLWVESLKTTYFGDANLDGEFNSGDMVFVFTTGEYEDELPGNSTWGTGDWDGDGDFTSGDFVEAFSGGGYEQGPRVATAAVPEPSSIGLLLLGVLAVRRRR